MIGQLDAAFLKAGRKRGPNFHIIVTPPLPMPVVSMQVYAEIDVDRLIVNIGTRRPERVDERMSELQKLTRLVA
jgi:hypothetical protein